MFSNQLSTLLLLCLLALTALGNDCPKDAEEFLVTFHPHLDAFWLDTDDDLKDINFRPAGFLYAMNQRNSKTIFNSMLDALSKNATRKYFVSEVVFFKDWYDYLSADKQRDVRKLFEKGQLDIANAGWVENDEAVCYIDDIIDQYTLGNNFLNAEFGLTPKIGWATDSFGHSHSQVAI
jgi:lysosomal alpha-mannosidase